MIRAAEAIRDAMARHAGAATPIEACGIVSVGIDGSWSGFHPLPNRARSPERFVIDPADLFGIISKVEPAGGRIGGVFHSHPSGAAVPSPIDIAEWPDAGWVSFVAGRVGNAWEIRAYRLDDGRAAEIPIEWTPSIAELRSF